MYNIKNTETGEIIYSASHKSECEDYARWTMIQRPGAKLEVIESPDSQPAWNPQQIQPGQKPAFYMIINTETGKPIFTSERRSDCEYYARMNMFHNPGTKLEVVERYL